jgi:hypothetical protein
MKKTTMPGRQRLVGAGLCLLVLLAGCNKKESTVTPAPPSNEFLTTVELKLTNTADATDTQTAIWRQLDPTGAALPDTSLAVMNLKANATYSAQVILLDETQKPAVVVSDEILQRANYHLFFFQPTPIAASSLVIGTGSTDIPASDGTVVSASGPYLNLVVSRTDHDTNNPPLPVGLTDNFVAGAASTGWLRVVLRHQPNVKNGTYDPGSSDLDVNYQVTIK